MKHLTRIGWLMAAGVLTVATDTRAQNPLTASTVGTFVVNAQVKLSVSAVSLTFANSDPDTTPSIVAAQGPVTVVAKARNTGSNQVLLSVQASDDLRSGLDVISISKLGWTATGAGFAPTGTLSTSAQTLASWITSGDYTGAVTYQLANSWTYAVGNYVATLTFTLTTP